MTDTSKLEAELIQVAAVAAAIVQDLTYGSTSLEGYDGKTALQDVMLRIEHERGRQEDKWGPQHHHPAVWMAILGEEVGEAADQTPYSGPAHTEQGYQANLLIDKLRRIEKVARKVLAVSDPGLVISCAGGDLCGVCQSSPCQKFRAHIK